MTSKASFWGQLVIGLASGRIDVFSAENASIRYSFGHYVWLGQASRPFGLPLVDQHLPFSCNVQAVHDAVVALVG